MDRPQVHISGQGLAARWLEVKPHPKARAQQQPGYSHRDATWSPEDHSPGSSPQSGPSQTPCVPATALWAACCGC